MHLIAIIANLRPQDLINVLFLSFLTCRLYSGFREPGPLFCWSDSYLGHCIHNSPNLRTFPDDVGLPDPVASPCGRPHYPFSVGDQEGLGAAHPSAGACPS